MKWICVAPHYKFDFFPDSYAQVRVFRLVVQNSLEQQILDRASFKLNIDAKIIQAGMFNNNASDEMRREMLVCSSPLILLSLLFKLMNKKAKR